VAEANADKVRRQREADAAARRASEIATFQAEQAIAEQQAVANRKRAEAEMAFELQKKTMEIQIQEQEISRKEKELDATIKRQADAKRYEIETIAAATRSKVETEAEAERQRLSAVAEGEKARGLAAAAVVQAQGIAEAEARKAQGLAEAEARKAQGLAEALGMEKKAEAWRKYNEAAVMQILAPLLPEIARAVAEPLSRIDHITMVNTGGGNGDGVSRITGEVAKVIAQVPPVVESLTGVRMGDLIERLRHQPAEDGKPLAEAPVPPSSRDKGDTKPS
jgi:flotillin